MSEKTTDSHLEQMQILGSRDLTMLENLMRHPDWEMPENLHRILPAKLALYIQKAKPGGRGWFKAIQLLYWMHEANRRQSPPPQDINLNLPPQMAEAMETVQRMSEAEREKLAAAFEIVERLQANAQN